MKGDDDAQVVTGDVRTAATTASFKFSEINDV